MSSGDLCTIPAGVSPDGSYNLVDPPSLGPVVIAVGVVLAVISTALGAGRLYTYRNMLQSPDCEFSLLKSTKPQEQRLTSLSGRLHASRLSDKRCLHGYYMFW